MSLFDRLSVLKNKSEIKLIESKQVVEDKVFEIRHGKLDDIPMTKERKRSVFDSLSMLFFVLYILSFTIGTQNISLTTILLLILFLYNLI